MCRLYSCPLKHWKIHETVYKAILVTLQVSLIKSCNQRTHAQPSFMKYGTTFSLNDIKEHINDNVVN